MLGLEATSQPVLGEEFCRIFKDLLEDLGEDLCKDPQQRSLKIVKDP